MNKISGMHIELLEDQGFCLIENFFSQGSVEHLKELKLSGNIRFCLEKLPELRVYAQSVIQELSTHYKSLFFNRSIFFNKTPDKNWAVLWHQDHTIAVKEKIETGGYGPWSVKEGIPHVQPPKEILERMLTVRIHIDSCNENNGALRVIPRSHKNGILKRNEIQQICKNEDFHTCKSSPGSILLMKPLILHSSESANINNSSRRVLHLEFLSESLHRPLKLYHS